MRMFCTVALLGVLSMGVVASAQNAPAAPATQPAATDATPPAVMAAAVTATASGSPDSVIVAVAGSENKDPKAAGLEAAKAAIAACGGQAKGIVVFEDSKDPEAVVAGVMAGAAGVPMIGTHAESLVSDKTLTPGVGVAVMAFGGKDVKVQTAVADLNKDREKTAADLVEKLKGFKDAKVVLVLSEPDLSFEEGVNGRGLPDGHEEGLRRDARSSAATASRSAARAACSSWTARCPSGPWWRWPSAGRSRPSGTTPPSSSRWVSR